LPDVGTIDGPDDRGRHLFWAAVLQRSGALEDCGQMPDGSGWVLGLPQGHGLLAGSGGMQQIPGKILARGGGI